MFDITHVNTFMDLVANPKKYQTYLEELNAQEKAWRETLGASNTLALANSKLSQAEAVLLSAAEKSSKIVAEAKAIEDTAKDILAKAQSRIAALDRREQDVATTNKAAIELREKARESLSRARAEEIELGAQSRALSAEKELCAELQRELNSRLDKIKSVLA